MAKNSGRIVYSGSSCRYFVGDEEVTEAQWNERFPSKLDDALAAAATLASHSPGCWPMVSEALAVHPDQVDAANERARKHGIAVRYEKGTGLCQIDSDGDKVKLVRLEGFANKQAGYR